MSLYGNGFKDLIPRRIYHCRRVSAFLIDKTMLQIGFGQAWLWIAIEEPIHKQILVVYISRHRNMIVACRIIPKIFSQSIW
jgi:transposase-like protein